MPQHLFHFTSITGWQQIRKTGLLQLCPSRANRRMAGPGVVWLTTMDKFDDPAGMGLAYSPTVAAFTDFELMDKTRIRIEVEVAKTYTHRYADWAPRHGGDPSWQADLRRMCRHYGTWRVHTKPIARTHWVSILDVLSGRTLSIAPTPQELGFRKLHA
jgi:hypothetical protein